MSATHLSRWVHPNGTTKSHPPPSIVKALTPSQLADTPSSTPSRRPFLGGPELQHHCRDAGEIATSPADYFVETVLISVAGHRVPGRRAAFTD
jgi:hypothetical protein